MDDENDLMPRIVVDRKAKEYVETDEEEEEVVPELNSNDIDDVVEDEIAPPKVIKDLPVSRKKKEIFQGVEEEEEVAIVEKPKPVRKARKPPSQQQLDHLAKIRVKAQDAKKKKQLERQQAIKEGKPVSNVKPQKVKYIESKITDEDVDRLIDRYKTRRKVKKDAKKADEHARQVVQSHYTPTEQPQPIHKSFSDFF